MGFFLVVLQYLNKMFSGVLSVAMMSAVNSCKVQLCLARKPALKDKEGLQNKDSSMHLGKAVI